MADEAERNKRRERDVPDANDLVFNPNFNNPFLITSYAQPFLGDLATINELTSTSDGSLSTILELFSTYYNIDFATFTLSISTIIPSPPEFDPTQTISMFGEELVFYADSDITMDSQATINMMAINVITIETPLVSMNQDLTVGQLITTASLTATEASIDTLYFSTAEGTTLTITDGFFSTLTGSSIIADSIEVLATVTDDLGFSTMLGSSIVADSIEVLATVTDDIGFSTAVGSSIVADSIEVLATVTDDIGFSTAVGSSIVADSIEVVSLQITDFGFSTAVGSSIVADSIEVLATVTDDLGFSTMLGSSIVADSIEVLATVTDDLGFSTMLGSSIVADSIEVLATVTDDLGFSTMLGSSIVTDFMTVNSTLITSSVTSIYISTIEISTNSLLFSSIYMAPESFSSLTAYTNTGANPISSILININGTMWKIPIELA